ncbi:MAG TPA: ASKHA domain-containing protein, partial [Anaerolineae bacterium]|nr:ASKHA domain-containing protein [Anaerolineae bacterium]
MPPQLAIAVDLGTSGIRAQALDLTSGTTLGTAITTRHPLPGANVMDHLHFALEMGVETAQRLLLVAVNQVIAALPMPPAPVVRLALCGNPIQLSLFQGSEIRDLAYAGPRKLESLGVVPPAREAAVLSARDIPSLALPPHCEVIIPPAVRHEIGADTLALILQTGMLERDETSLATDYGTNAEIVLYHKGRVLTGSTAAGPALEGQQITWGMLAAPGAISDLTPDTGGARLWVLDAEMRPRPGPLAALADGRLMDVGLAWPVGITGTGVIALVDQAI